MAMRHFLTRFVPVVLVAGLVMLALILMGGQVSGGLHPFRGGVCPEVPVTEQCPTATP